VDTWWQTETGGIMIAQLHLLRQQKPTYATLPLPGVQAVLMDDTGNEIEGNQVVGKFMY
jgi:acetyl-CoA synthetase